jgi:hypothetical protein
MSDDYKRDVDEEVPRSDRLTERVTLEPPIKPKGPTLLPGLVAIAFYMLVLAAVVSFGVVGGHFPALFLIFAALFVTASFGLLRLFRWAWALSLAATLMLLSYNFWIFASQHQMAGAVQGGLNLVFFFYLVREDVRSRLR